MKSYGWAGLIIALASFILVFFSHSWELIGSFLLGWFLLFDALDYKLTNYSLLQDKASKLFFLAFIGAVGGIVVEFLGTMILDTWKYNVFSINTLVSLPFGLSFAWFDPQAVFVIGVAWSLITGVSYETYRVLIFAFRKASPPAKKARKRKQPKSEATVLRLSGALGFILLVPPIIFRALNNTIPFDHMLYIIGVFFLADYIAFKRKRKTFIGEALKGAWHHLAAAALTSVPYILTEVVNAQSNAWTLTRAFFGPKYVIPVLLLLVMPLFFVSLAAFYNALVSDEKVLATDIV